MVGQSALQPAQLEAIAEDNGQQPVPVQARAHQAEGARALAYVHCSDRRGVLYRRQGFEEG